MPEPIKRVTITATGDMDGEYFRAPDVIKMVEGLKMELIYGAPLGMHGRQLVIIRVAR